MFAFGIDVGYSAVKICFGDAEASPQTRVLPAGAGRVEDLPAKIGGGSADDGVMVVTVEGEKWAAGVDHARLETTVRQLHPDYPSTAAYRALFHAALILGERKEVDHLVTGLPTSQALDRGFANRLRERLLGEHQVSERRTIKVHKVTVLPQPAGAYCDLVGSFEDTDLLAEARIMVIDPGFFSVDWVALENGEIRKASSGTSRRAMSVLIETVNGLIREEQGGGPGVDRIEQAIRNGTGSVPVYGDKVDLAPFIAKAAERVATDALTEMKQMMRQNERAVDIVLIAGGGAHVYEAAAREVFPKSKIIVPQEPVVANARGFWNYALQ